MDSTRIGAAIGGIAGMIATYQVGWALCCLPGFMAAALSQQREKNAHRVMEACFSIIAKSDTMAVIAGATGVMGAVLGTCTAKMVAGVYEKLKG